MPFFSRHLKAWIDPADVFTTLYSKDAYSFWLDRENHPKHRYSVMGHAATGSVSSTDEALSSATRSLEPSSDDVAEVPFAWRPGFVGWLDYPESGYAADSSLGQDTTLKGVWLRANEALVLDHDERTIWMAGEFGKREHFEEWVKAALIRLGLSGGGRISYLRNHAPAESTRVTKIQHNGEAYQVLVNRAKNHIAVGDVYQICLTNRLEFTHGLDPLATFLQLRATNPAPYAAFIKAGERALVCASPEQFLSITTDGIAITRPIKGTRPRSADFATDELVASELRTNEKERAENLMIVDLMRNDLGKVSQPESVEVTELFEVEKHPTVHQLVSTVKSQLIPTASMRDVLESVFPGGSMTGAPKYAAMELIDDLEGKPRGTYSGICGYISTDGSADFGMTIRSIVFESENTASIGVGGGITIDSHPLAELEETRIKAAALLAVLGVSNPWT